MFKGNRPSVQAGSSSSWKEMLLARPVKNDAAEVELADKGHMKVRVKRIKSWYHKPPFSWVLPARDCQSVSMDSLGARVWQLCDGTRNVEGVIDAFAAEYDLSFHESRTAVTNYIKELIRRGVLAIVLPQDSVL